MTVPKNIAEKAQEWERLCERMEVLGAELRQFFIPHMDGCYDLDFFYSEDAEGDPQGDGEFCDQGGNPDEGYSGNYYYPAEGGGFVGVGYSIF